MIAITSARFWHNLLAKLLQRIKKLPGTPESIAIGIACGVAVSFTPFLGLHMLIAAGSAWLLGGSIIASAIGTIVGNPWTFPFIWVAVLYTGRKLLRLEHNAEPTDFEAFFSAAWQALKELDIETFGHDIWPILWPMIIGSIPFYIIFWILSYFLVKHSLVKHSLVK